MLNGHFESLIPKEVKAENVVQINLAYRGIQYYPFTLLFDIKNFCYFRMRLYMSIFGTFLDAIQRECLTD